MVVNPMASVEPRSTFDREFGAIQETLQDLHARVDTAIANSLESLVKRDRALAQQIIEKDAEINKLRFSVEETCLALIASQQPAATDLRAVIAAMNIATEMERMADHAAGIAKTVILMGDEPLLKPLIDIPRMNHLAREMLSGSLESFRQRDSANAMAVALRDDNMDKLYKAIFDELIEIMAINPGSATRATYLLWCAHNLERIGDRVTNIAERVVFVSTGDLKELNV
jgi:phosphate transport system protein